MAARTREICLVHELVEPHHLDDAVQVMLDGLLGEGPQAQAASTELISVVANRPETADLIEDCARRIAPLRASSKAKERLAPFLEKRAPA